MAGLITLVVILFLFITFLPTIVLWYRRNKCPKCGASIPENKQYCSQLTPDRLAVCVASGDVKAITAAQGVGAKIAQRVVLELKDKLKSYISQENGEEIAAINAASASDSGEEAVAALVMLGYGKSEAAAAVGRLDQTLSAEELIKQALRLMAKNI